MNDRRSYRPRSAAGIAAILLVSTLSLGRAAWAQGSLLIAGATGEPGGTAVVAVTGSADLAIAGLSLKIQFDPSLGLSPADIHAGSFGLQNPTFGTNAGAAVLVFAGSQSVHGPGEIAELTFHIPVSAPSGMTYPITVTSVKANDETHAFTPPIQSGAVTVSGSAMAAGEVVISDAPGDAGGVAIVSISADAHLSLAGLILVVSFDPSLQLAVLDIEAGSLALANPTFNTMPGRATLVFSGSRSVQGPGEIARLRFHIPTDAPQGMVYPIHIATIKGNDETHLFIPNVHDGSVRINLGLPVVALSPTPALDFGARRVTTTGGGRTVMLTNVGTAPLVVSAASITGPASADYSLDPVGFPLMVAAGGSVAFMLHFAPGAAGARNAALSFVDNAGGSPHVLALTGSGLVNHPPIAGDQSVTLNHDSSIAIPLTATDPDNDPLNYVIVSPPAHGTLGAPGSTVTYTPNPGYSGSDSFIFQVNDGVADSNIATVSLTVAPPNPVRPKGDLNGDGVVDMKDVTQALQIAAGGVPPPSPPSPGDLNNDGKIDLKDVVLLLTEVVSSGNPTGCADLSAGAGPRQAAQISVADVTGTPGQPVTLSIDANAVLGIAAGKFTLSFDPRLFTFVSSDPKDPTADIATGSAVHFPLVAADPSNPCRLVVGLVSSQNSDRSGNLFTVPLMVNADAPTPSSSAITLQAVLNDRDGNTVAVTVANASVTIGTPGDINVPGDVNGDGKIDLKDATLSLQIAVGLLPGVTAAQQKADDVNKDLRYDLKDTTLILEAAVGLIKLG